MKTLRTLSIAVLGIVCLAQASQAQDSKKEKEKPGINWMTNLETAHKKAKDEGKVLMIYFDLDVCYVNVYRLWSLLKDENFVKTTRDLVAVKISRKDSEKLLRKFNLKDSSAVIFIDPKGNEIVRYLSTEFGLVRFTSPIDKTDMDFKDLRDEMKKIIKKHTNKK